MCFNTFFFFFFSLVSCFICSLLSPPFCVFSVCVSEALMFPKDISPSSVSRKVVALWNATWKRWLGLQTHGSKSCRPCRRSGPQLRTSATYTSKLTSSCLEQRRFSLCVRIHRHSNPTAGGGGGSFTAVSQLVLCLFLPSKTLVEKKKKKNPAPEVWSSMQLIYYPRRCNTTGIQETVNVLMAFRLTAFQFSSPYARACFSSCPPFICPSTVRKTAALKGNYFIPKHGCYSDCGAVFLNVYRESDHRCALREWRRVTDSASKLLLFV